MVNAGPSSPLKATKFLRLALCLLPLFSVAAGWGADGHTIIAHIAEAHLPPEIDSALRAALGNISLSDASTWCDDFDHTSEGRWSSELHYINLPGQECEFIWERDCVADWCVAGALANFSQQLFDPASTEAGRRIALEFVIHLMGDLHQPLHVGRTDDEGGNLIKLPGFRFSTNPAQWHTATETLHAIWDSAIVQQAIYDIQFNSTMFVEDQLAEPASKYKEWWLLSNALVERLRNEWASFSLAWTGAIAGGARSEARLRSGITAIAGETAAAGCGYAYQSEKGQQIVSGTLLDREYYLWAKPVVEEQLAKAGVRLAQLLTEGFEGMPAGARRSSNKEAVLVV